METMCHRQCCLTAHSHQEPVYIVSRLSDCLWNPDKGCRRWFGPFHGTGTEPQKRLRSSRLRYLCTAAMLSSSLREVVAKPTIQNQRDGHPENLSIQRTSCLSSSSRTSWRSKESRPSRLAVLELHQLPLLLIDFTTLQKVSR